MERDGETERKKRTACVHHLCMNFDQEYPVQPLKVRTPKATLMRPKAQIQRQNTTSALNWKMSEKKANITRSHAHYLIVAENVLDCYLLRFILVCHRISLLSYHILLRIIFHTKMKKNPFSNASNSIIT